MRIASPRHAIGHRIAFSSENRHAEGIVADLTVGENIALGIQARRGWHRKLRRAEYDAVVTEYIEALGVRPADPNVVVGTLSGGNQQKVLLARWLATAPELIILDEPTRGIDVGAKADIQRKVAELSSQGLSVIFISSELEEVLRLAQRVVVMRDRRRIGVLELQGRRRGRPHRLHGQPGRRERRVRRILKHRLFWPVFSLLALIVVNTVARPQFMKITVRDGELYGALIDILRNSAPLMLVALGMTLVIATRGIDLSVGAVMAVSGAVALTIIDGSSSPGSTGTVLVAIAVGVGCRAAARGLERLPRGGPATSNRSSRRWCSCSPGGGWPC